MRYKESSDLFLQSFWRKTKYNTFKIWNSFYCYAPYMSLKSLCVVWKPFVRAGDHFGDACWSMAKSKELDLAKARDSDSFWFLSTTDLWRTSALPQQASLSHNSQWRSQKPFKPSLNFVNYLWATSLVATGRPAQGLPFYWYYSKNLVKLFKSSKHLLIRRGYCILFEIKRDSSFARVACCRVSEDDIFSTKILVFIFVKAYT
jgi:hypothetical protein